MKFWKMHGLGNDFVIIDNREGKIGEEAGELARKLCERRFSIGADGLILLCNSHAADVQMRIYNADGSQAETCGNGIRCVAKYCYETSIVQQKFISVETLAGIIETWLTVDAGLVRLVKVDIGKPILERSEIPMIGHGKFVNEEIEIKGEKFKATCLSIGNPHCVIFVSNLKSFPVERIGPKIENHKFFPKKTNVEFAEVLNDTEMNVRVWERGVGETLACGTGACASAAAGRLLGITRGKSIIHLLGGDLEVEYDGLNIVMTGPSEKIFEGLVEC